MELRTTFYNPRDNHNYPTVPIGSQCWFAEDLRYGSAIIQTQHQRDNCISEKYYFRVGSSQYAVYQWDEIMDYSTVAGEKGLCPPNWHVPTEAEWQLLFSNWTNNGFAASPLKYTGFSGFDAFVSGMVPQNTILQYSNFAIFYWSSTAHGPYKAWAHGINEPDPSVSVYPSTRQNAFSVRCLKDN